MFSFTLGNKCHLVAGGRSTSGLHKQQQCTWFLFYYQATFNRGNRNKVSVLDFLPFHWLVRLGNCPGTSVHPGSRRSAMDAEVFVAWHSLNPEVSTSAEFACKSTHSWLVPRWRFSNLAVHQNDFQTFKKCKSWNIYPQSFILNWSRALLASRFSRACPGDKVIGITVTLVT